MVGRFDIIWGAQGSHHERIPYAQIKAAAAELSAEGVDIEHLPAQEALALCVERLARQDRDRKPDQRP